MICPQLFKTNNAVSKNQCRIFAESNECLRRVGHLCARHDDGRKIEAPFSRGQYEFDRFGKFVAIVFPATQNTNRGTRNSCGIGQSFADNDGDRMNNLFTRLTPVGISER
ncbi:hypothetical protein Pla52n_06180 [Stieleria varia]|uniref:Uncharacterized protein n=1 Tax=Stieleria varia TaxID=2528005 RepID=A0A5C6B7V9_9BACT|nr:hypothetical protein Pla52n_06180 [Stieleria varia]